MFKRVTIVALVAAAFLVLAVPALAWNGLREDYTTTGACASCHTTGSFGAPKVYNEWLESKHAENEAYSEVASRLPYRLGVPGLPHGELRSVEADPCPGGYFDQRRRLVERLAVSRRLAPGDG